jgi:hypothetical protein
MKNLLENANYWLEDEDYPTEDNLEMSEDSDENINEKKFNDFSYEDKVKIIKLEPASEDFTDEQIDGLIKFMDEDVNGGPVIDSASLKIIEY